MRNIQHMLMAGILVLSASGAMAAPEAKETATPPGFHALSQVTDSRAQTVMALTDTQLDTITGREHGESHISFEVQLAVGVYQATIQEREGRNELIRPAVSTLVAELKGLTPSR